MDISKSEEFTSALMDLARSQSFWNDKSERVKFYHRFEDIYYVGDSKYYRHLYSDIFTVITRLQDDSEIGSTETLIQNLSQLIKNYRSCNTDSNENVINIEPCLRKLYDHVSLEMARYNFYDKQYNNDTERADVRALKSKIEDTEKRYKKMNRKLDSVQQEYVAILGVFAAIILAFVGGITFSSSVLQNIDKVSIYRLLITVDLLGFVLINVINLLFEFICHILEKERKFSVFLKWLNIIFLVLALAILAAWIFKFDRIRCVI